MEQEIKQIHLKDLVLWTENPRDSIDPECKDQDIIDRALADVDLKWTLPKLAKEMGEYYDLSELPTVVYHNGIPVVYDGNRRIALAKIKHGLVSLGDVEPFDIPTVPLMMNCNVCSRSIALKNVWRKHATSGSWKTLERDIFLNKHMGKKKTPFLVLEESTQLISNSRHLNQNFVKNEIFNKERLNQLGFDIQKEKLFSKHSKTDAKKILQDLSTKVKEKKLNTRDGRGRVMEILSPETQSIIEKNKERKSKLLHLDVSKTQDPSKQRRSKRTKSKGHTFFGGVVYLESGDVNNLYRDIHDLCDFYEKQSGSLTSGFTNLIRMSLRLLVEVASNGRMQDYIQKNFDTAKKNIDNDMRTTLSNQNVTKASLLQLLQSGAHNYTNSANIEQTIAMSIVVGGMLTSTHGKDLRQ